MEGSLIVFSHIHRAPMPVQQSSLFGLSCPRLHTRTPPELRTALLERSCGAQRSTQISRKAVSDGCQS